MLALALVWTLSFLRPSCGQTVSVRHKEGVSHGFLVLRTFEGETIATGDLIQEVKGFEVTSELVFHSKTARFMTRPRFFLSAARSIC
jgi:hypothetical protein